MKKTSLQFDNVLKKKAGKNISSKVLSLGSGNLTALEFLKTFVMLILV